MRTLGIDPGIAIMGFGIVEESERKLKALDYGCIRTDKGLPAQERLLALSLGLDEIIKKFSPDQISVEKLFFCTNSKTALSVGEARGVILLAAGKHNLPVGEYTPLQVKIAVTGYGKAEKKQVQKMVKTILCLEETPKPDDVADALAIAICHLHSYNVTGKR